MLLLVPYSTDAPVYHYPWATLGAIAANVGVHLAWSLLPPEAAEPFALKLGAGLHPLQWLTHNFLHADFLHLLFNMVFLWAYGIVVEGKVGWWRFLLIYGAIGVAHGAAVQAAYLGASTPGHVVGASAIVFGLMAIDMLWAPANDLSCFYMIWVGFRLFTNTVELPIYAFALLQLALEALSVGLTYLIRGDPLSSGLLHLSGAAWGLAVGLIFLRLGLVDCEGWDVFSLLKKRRELRRAWVARGTQQARNRENDRLPRSAVAAEDRPGLPAAERLARLRSKLDAALALGDEPTTHAAFARWLDAAGRPPREDLLAIIKALQARGDGPAAVPPMRALCRLYPDRADKVRLVLAAHLLRDLERPTEARRHLRLVAEDRLADDAQRRYLRKLLAEAERLIDEGVLEVEERE